MLNRQLEYAKVQAKREAQVECDAAKVTAKRAQAKALAAEAVAERAKQDCDKQIADATAAAKQEGRDERNEAAGIAHKEELEAAAERAKQDCDKQIADAAAALEQGEKKAIDDLAQANVAAAEKADAAADDRDQKRKNLYQEKLTKDKDKVLALGKKYGKFFNEMSGEKRISYSKWEIQRGCGERKSRHVSARCLTRNGK